MALIFAGLLVVSLCYPSPQGPGDNGDFGRLFGSFSTGPVGLEHWPPSTDPSWQARFFSFHHRFWRRDGGLPGGPWRSSSQVLYAPGLLLPLTGRQSYDLTLNTLYLILIASGALWLTLRALGRGIPFVSLGAVALLMADAGVASYLSSFFAESGAWLFLLLLFCSLHLYWQAPSAGRLGLVLACDGLLAATKLAYAPSAALLVAPVLGGALLLRPRSGGGHRGARCSRSHRVCAGRAGVAARSADRGSCVVQLRRR